MRTVLIIIAAIAMTACTSTRSLSAPEQANIVGIDAGDAITLTTTDGTELKGRFVAIDAGDIVYDDRTGATQRVALNTASSLSYRAYDSEKTGEVVAGTVKITGMVLIGLAQVVGALAQGMSY